MRLRFTFPAASLVGLAVSMAAATAQAAPAAPVVVVPPLAFEDTHILVAWDRSTSGSTPTSYHVFKNGADIATVSTVTWPNGTTNLKLYYDMTGLTANTSYSIKVRAYDSGGGYTDSNTVTQSTTAAPAVVTLDNVSTSGVQTAAIQSVINSCPTNGKVTLSSGKTLTSGALYLKSNCTYQINGTIKGSDAASDYAWGNNRFPKYGSGGSWGTVAYPTNYKSLINTCTTADNACTGLTNIRMTGSGLIQGSSGSASDSQNSGYYLSTTGIDMRTAQGSTDTARSDLVSLTGVNGIFISGLRFTLPAMHMLFIARSSNITVYNINANSWPSGSSKGIHNGDGIDLATSYSSVLPATSQMATNAYIIGSTFDNGDDCINMNAGTNSPGVYANTPINGVHVLNNYTLHGHGAVVAGSFTAAWIKNVYVFENTFNGTEIGLRFKTGTNRGGGADGVWAYFNKMSNILKYGINVEGSYPDSTGMAAAGTGSFKNINVYSLTGSGASGAYAVNINGNSSPKNSGFKFTNVNVTGSGGKGVSVYKTTCATNPCFTNVTAASGSFVFESASISASAFSGCSPAPTAK